MISTFEKLDKGCTITSPNKNIIKKTIIRFVDDKRQYTNDWINICLLATTNNLQDAAQGWEYLFYTTGGQLELTKCVCFCIIVEP